ncbi:MAG: AAA family ATPase [Acidobacteria bacterium]|nr:AAA family ATPase [Acidobacteriota bacterium]
MRISRIAVRNHSRVPDLELEVREHMVLVGANDVGKTSLLRLLHLMLGSSSAQLYQVLSLADLRDPTSVMMAEIILTHFNDDERAAFPLAISIDPVNKTESLSLRLEVSTDNQDPDMVIVHRWFPESGNDRAPTREQIRAFAWRYLPATRGTSVAQLGGPDSALRALFEAIDLGVEKGELTSLLDTFNEKLGASEVLGTLKEKIADHLSRSMPTTMGPDDLAVRTSADPAASVLDSVSMFFDRGGIYIPITHQSDGLRHLMAMTLFDLAEGTANIVAIDEPELHLHPTSQRTVAELLGYVGNQKILATHSPYIVHRFEPSQVVAISPDGAAHQMTAGKLSAVEKVRAHWWSPRLLEALTARFVVIVEGAADRVIVEGAARVLGVALDRMGAVVLEIDGANKFPNVYKLLGPDGFGVSVLSLVDVKEKGGWLGAIGGKQKNVIGSKLWISDADLEDEYCKALSGPVAGQILIDAGCCREAGLLSSCGVGTVEDLTSEDVASFCRDDKVTSAVAIAAALDTDTAGKIASAAGLLTKLKELSSR